MEKMLEIKIEYILFLTMQQEIHYILLQERMNKNQKQAPPKSRSPGQVEVEDMTNRRCLDLNEL
jgi:hypothetical protein